jgi:Pro-kumamolisin, activation domain
MRLLRVVFFLLLLAPFADAAERQALRGHVPNAAKQLTPLKGMESTTHLELTIALPLRNAAGLNRLLEEIYNPSSPNYHQYLTPGEFAKQFGPSQEDYKALMAFAKSNHLTIIGTHPNRTLLDVNGSIADIEKALHVNMRVYKHPGEARTFRAPDADPSVDLAMPLLSISGLDDYNLPRPMNTRAASFRKFLERSDPKDKRGRLGTPDDTVIPYTTGSGPRAAFMGNDFRSAYASGVALDGAGQAVGLFELDGYFPTDIT